MESTTHIYVYIYIYIYIYIYTHTYSHHTHSHIYSHPHTHTQTPHTHIHSRTLTHACTYTHWDISWITVKYQQNYDQNDNNDVVLLPIFLMLELLLTQICGLREWRLRERYRGRRTWGCGSWTPRTPAAATRQPPVSSTIYIKPTSNLIKTPLFIHLWGNSLVIFER